MSLAKDLDVTPDRDSDWGDIVIPPCDLYSDEPPLESDLHLQQIILLLQCLEYLWRDRADFYATGNSTIYFNPDRLSHEILEGLISLWF